MSNVLINGRTAVHVGSGGILTTVDVCRTKIGKPIVNTIKGKAEFITASSNVFIEGVAAVRQGDMMVSNNRNTAPMPLMQPGAVSPASLEKQLGKSLEASRTPFKIAVERAGEESL
jgi:uncharacterized Zn-binding protein involved in type VI secretion